MDNYQQIKQLGATMLSEANSSDKQEFGSFYLSRFLGFKTTYKEDLASTIEKKFFKEMKELEYL